jgi:hypothetical protein
MNYLRLKMNPTTVLATALTFATMTPCFAGDFQQHHPRRAQVLGRAGNINRRINNNYGHLGGNYGHLQRQDQSIVGQEQRDAHRNGGYITPGQQGKLNREANSVSRETFFDNKNNQFVQNHPRRSQTLARDANVNYSINRDEGHLGGNYKTLAQGDRSIAQQEQQDAKSNGGFITRSQQQQINQEEGQLRQQVNQDFTGR